MNRTTRAQRINAKYEKIWAKAARLKTETRFNASSRIEERPCAAEGLTSYRYQGRYGWIMIGAKDDADAIREARHSTPEVVLDRLQVWDGECYVQVGA